ncbi:MAG: hypothetical protein RJA81_2296 [Planctomycetota bacterium]|jgi:ATP adenylyltransferase
MKHLWAPWRMQYILQSAVNRKSELQKSSHQTEKPQLVGADVSGLPCFICDALNAGPEYDRANYLVWRGEVASVLLNKYPYNNGHLLVVPNDHIAELTSLSEKSLTEPVRLMQSCLNVLNLMMEPQGYNVGLNQGRIAGAGLPGHLHWHIVPRWLGDVNFMPAVADTRVIVDSLEAFYDRFAKEFAEYQGQNL